MVRLENVSLIVNEKEELVGVGIAIPSMTKALQKAKGKLFPFGFIHILKALRGKNDVVDLLLRRPSPRLPKYRSECIVILRLDSRIYKKRI